MQFAFGEQQLYWHPKLRLLIEHRQVLKHVTGFEQMLGHEITIWLMIVPVKQLTWLMSTNFLLRSQDPFRVPNTHPLQGPCQNRYSPFSLEQVPVA